MRDISQHELKQPKWANLENCLQPKLQLPGSAESVHSGSQADSINALVCGGSRIGCGSAGGWIQGSGKDASLAGATQSARAVEVGGVEDVEGVDGGLNCEVLANSEAVRDAYVPDSQDVVGNGVRRCIKDRLRRATNLNKLVRGERAGTDDSVAGRGQRSDIFRVVVVYHVVEVAGFDSSIVGAYIAARKDVSRRSISNEIAGEDISASDGG